MRDTPAGPIPVISGSAELQVVTKTDYKLERDDDSHLLASMTKTGNGEADDIDSGLFASTRSEQPQEDQLLLLVTKTLNHRERDD